MKKIGLCLGGGGAKGFAHIPILEVMDDLGVKPACISGTSIGAIVGALYASGRSAREIADLSLFPKPKGLKEALKSKDLGKLWDMIDPDLGWNAKGLLKGEKVLGFLEESLKVKSFEELDIPFRCVATDFWNYEAVAIDSGNLLEAIRASMAIPYVFAPISKGGQVLVDGGLTNNVPVDLLDDDCDIKIAINLRGERSTPKDKIPNALDAVFHSYDIMMEATTQAKLESYPVDIYLHAPVVDVDVMDFHRAEEVYQQGLPMKHVFREQLEAALWDSCT
ncbi:patatin-like phospholipase family protein [Rubritalea marina]|uniref:patatin-like phospholipase family protein n=1 Tax=Rubritalea marina TaxID=361055 RepID=UPI0003804498|nr:patatin-like phospholipase family protein [Rubritalea marina]